MLLRGKEVDVGELIGVEISLQYLVWRQEKLLCKVHYDFSKPLCNKVLDRKRNLDNNFTKDKILWFTQINYCQQ